jgi:hypothetical protein
MSPPNLADKNSFFKSSLKSNREIVARKTPMRQRQNILNTAAHLENIQTGVNFASKLSPFYSRVWNRQREETNKSPWATPLGFDFFSKRMNLGP